MKNYRQRGFSINPFVGLVWLLTMNSQSDTLEEIHATLTSLRQEVTSRRKFPKELSSNICISSCCFDREHLLTEVPFFLWRARTPKLLILNFFWLIFGELAW